MTWHLKDRELEKAFEAYSGGKFVDALNYEVKHNPPKPIDNHPDAVTTRKYMAGDPETVKALRIFDE